MADDPKPGSPEWRDHQDAMFKDMIEHPEKWEFVITDDDKTAIISAYDHFLSEYKNNGVPDISNVRLLAGQFQKNEKSPLKFWNDFCKDMPDVMQRLGISMGLEAVWADSKIRRILGEAKKPFLDWDPIDVTMAYKNPDSMRQAADKLEALDEEGYGLYDTEIDADRGTVKYIFRKAVLVDPNKPKEEASTV